MTRTGLFQYVRHQDIETFHRKGWMVAGDLGPTHGQWSVLMWRCECPILSSMQKQEAAAA